MKMNRWMFVALLAGGAVVATRGCVAGCSVSTLAPDVKLASQFNDMCSIAKGGVKDPVGGVRKLGIYFVRHNGDMMKNFGDTVSLIEMIRDDKAHDDRARLARDTMFEPLDTCLETWLDFADAVEENEQASNMVEHAMDRLERTLNIIGGSSDHQRHFTLRELPAQLEHALGASLL